MSYKHRNDGLPDHMGESIADSTARKHVVPVDTIALKKRIDNDQKVQEKNRTYYDYKDDSGAFVGESELNNKGRAALRSEIARTDTLDKARQGKIPVTSAPSKKQKNPG